MKLTDADHQAISEAAFQVAVIALARSLGWGTTLSARKAMLTECAQYGVEPPPLDGLIYHPRYSLGSEPGWPDLTLIRRRDGRLAFAELKAEKGVLSPRQSEVIDLFRVIAVDVDIEVYVWRPSDLASGAIADVLR